MKKTFYSVLRTMCVGAMTLFAVSCYDDSALWGEIDRLDGRVDSLANVLNSQVATINEKVGALDVAYKAADEALLAQLQAKDAELATSLTALTAKLDALDGKVDGFIATEGAALKTAIEELKAKDKVLEDKDAEILEALVNVGIVKVEKKNGNAVLTFTDGSTLEVAAYDPNANNEGLVTTVEEDGVKYWAVVLADGTKKSLEVAVGHNDLKFQVNADTEELEYSVDGGATWNSTGAYVSTSQQVKIDFYQGETDEIDWDTYEYIKEDFFTLVFGGEEYYLPIYKVDNSVVTIKAGKTYFAYGELKTFDIALADVTTMYLMNKPDGWKAKLDGKVLTVTAPAESVVTSGNADADGEVLLHATTTEGNCKIARLAVATTPGFSLTVVGDSVTIVNPEVVTTTNRQGETVTDFNDAIVGLAPVAAFEADQVAYVSGIQDNYDDLSYYLNNWKLNTAEYDDDWNPTLTIGGAYEEGVYEVDVIKTTVPQMYADWTYGEELPEGSRFVVWACPVDDSGMPRTDEVVYAYYSYPVTAVITEVEATTSDLEVSVAVKGVESYYVGLVTEEQMYGHPIDAYMQNQEGPFGYFQMMVQYGNAEWALQSMGHLFGGEDGMEMPETIKASEIMGGALMPEMKVYMWVFPVVNGLAFADYTYEENMKPYIYEFTTAGLTAGGSATVEFGTADLEFTSMSVELAATEGSTMMYYNWYAPDDYNALTDVAADLLKNGYVLEGEFGVARNSENEVTPGSSFVLAALAVDAEGKYGDVTEDTFVAPEIVYSTTFTAAFGEEIYSPFSSGFRYDIPVTVTGGEAEMYYYVWNTQQFTDEELANLPLAWNYNYSFQTAKPSADGKLKGLYADAGTTYYLAVVVKSAEGEYAPVVKKEVKVPFQTPNGKQWMFTSEYFDALVTGGQFEGEYCFDLGVSFPVLYPEIFPDPNTAVIGINYEPMGAPAGTWMPAFPSYGSYTITATDAESGVMVWMGVEVPYSDFDGDSCTFDLSLLLAEDPGTVVINTTLATEAVQIQAQ